MLDHLPICCDGGSNELRMDIGGAPGAQLPRVSRLDRAIVSKRPRNQAVQKVQTRELIALNGGRTSGVGGLR